MKQQHHRNFRNFFILSILYIGLIVFGTVPNGFAQTRQNHTAEIVWSEFDGQKYQIYHSSYQSGQWKGKIKLSDNDADNIVPVIDSGSDGTLWVAWTAAKGSTSDLYICQYDSGRWSLPSKIPSSFSFNTSPSIFTGEGNLPWIVWSGFDGEDDEIFIIRRNGLSWTSPERVNRNDAAPDVNPVIWKDNDSIHAGWSGFNGKLYMNYISTYTEAGWADETEDSENKYQEFLKSIEDIMPPLPEFIQTSETAALCISSGGQKIAFRVQDMNRANQGKKAQGQLSTSNYPAAAEEIIIAFGDSITQGVPYVDGYGGGRRIGGYEPYLESLILGIGQPNQVLNYGVGGETTGSGVSRIQTVLANTSAKYVLILEGTNDLFFGYSPASTLYNLQAMVNFSYLYGTIPVLATLTPDTKNSGKYIESFNEQIKQYASGANVALSDQYAALAPNWYALTYDGIHPNDIGYQVMASAWSNAIPRMTVSTKEATDVGESSATLNGVINPRGYPASYYFEYGYNTNFGGKTPVMDAGSVNGDVQVSVRVDGISENQVYYFRLVGTNGYTTIEGDVLQLQTLEASSSKCFIATAAFGSSMIPHVVTLKAFRDRYLAKSSFGRQFIRFYYKYSPAAAKYISEHETLRGVVRTALYPAVWFCRWVFITSLWVPLAGSGLFILLFAGLGFMILKKK